MIEDQGASADADRATAVEPVPVSPLRDGIPSAVDLRGITDGGPWLVATVLSIAETDVVNHAMHARWLNRSKLPCPLEANDAGWGDLWAAGKLALDRYRGAQAIEATPAEPK